MSDKKISKKMVNNEEKIEKLEKTKRSKVIDLSSSESEEEVKPVKAKRVQSQAQKDAFEKARIKRAEQIAIRKEVKDKEDAKFNEYKNSMKIKKDAKALKKKEAELKQYESSSDESVVIVKKKKKSKKIVYISDDEEDKKPINIVINNSTPTQQPKIVKRIPVFL
jgi:hypothetical protein